MVPRFLFELLFNTVSVIFMEYTLILLLYYPVKLGVLNMLYPQAIFFCSAVNLYLIVLCWMNMAIIIFLLPAKLSSLPLLSFPGSQ